MRVFLQRRQRNQRCASADDEPLLGAAIGALRPDGSNQLNEIVAGRAGAERPAQVSSRGRVEAHQPDTVGGQAAAIAVPAKRPGRGCDDPERRAVRQREPIRGRRAPAANRLHCAVVCRDGLQDLVLRDDRLGTPPGGPAHVHVLDEPHLGAGAASELEQIDQLIVIGPARHDGVDFHGIEAGAGGRIDPRQDRRMLVEPGQPFEALTIERVEADGDAVQAGIAKGPGLVGQEDAVRREREVVDSRQRRQLRDEHRQIPAEQRLAARDPDPVGTDRHERAGERGDLLEREQRFAGQPGVVRLRHAVVTPQVAAVGHRDPEAPERPGEAITDGDGH